MNSSGDDSDDNVMAGAVGLEMTSRPSTYRALVRGDEARSVGVLAKGTCEQPPLMRDPGASALRSCEAREFDRDPAEVLRMWPHSTGMLEDHRVAARAAPPAPAGKRRSEDKIGLAHFALDLYREIEDLQTIASGAPRSAGPARSDHPVAVHPVAAHPMAVDPAHPDVAAACGDPSCEVRINGLRSALVEACLLAQRVVMMTPAAKGEVEGRIRELLKLIER